MARVRVVYDGDCPFCSAYARLTRLRQRHEVDLVDAREAPELVGRLRQQGYDALGVMERRLAEAPFLVGDRFGAADIALYAYTHVAHEGGFDLSAYPGIIAWLARVAAEPGHISIGER